MKLKLFFVAAASAFLTLASVTALAQESYMSEGRGYVLELPSHTWKVLRPDEFEYGNPSDGYLRIRRESVDANANLEEFAREHKGDQARVLARFRQ